MVSRQLSEALDSVWLPTLQRVLSADFNVNPKELGAIDVVMETGTALGRPNQPGNASRELLGDSLPRLRDALTQSGINLAQLQVGSESQQQGNAQGRQADSERAAQQVWKRWAWLTRRLTGVRGS